MSKKVFLKSWGCQMDKLLHSDFTLVEGMVLQGLTVSRIKGNGNR